MLSHLSAEGGTAKVCADWAFVSGVSPVSPNLKLIDRIQSGKGTGGISRHQVLCAETGGTGAMVARFYGTKSPLKEGFAMSHWVKCTFTRTPDNRHGVPGYINLGLAYQVYNDGSCSKVAFGLQLHEIASVRETPEELLAELTKTTLSP